MAYSPNSGVSLADVAKRAKVSAQTVSRVANGSDAVRPDTKKRVLDAMAELGYRPSFAARTLRAGSYKSIGLALAGDLDATGRRYQIDGIRHAAAQHKHALTLLQLEGEEISLGAASARMECLPVDGQILMLGAKPADFLTYEPPPALPTVIVSTSHHAFCPTVSHDQAGCSTTIVDHFIKHGHREIRYVGGPRDSYANIRRLNGWKQAMRTRGLNVVEPLHGNWTADAGYELGAQLAGDPTCTAIYAANDAIAVGVIYALRDAGLRVPHDVSVVGVDDSLVDVIPHLELSSYRFNDAQAGRIAFKLALDPPQGKEPPHILVPGTLIERTTVCAARC